MSRVALVTDDLDIERRLFQGIGPDRFTELVTIHASLVNAEPTVAVAELVQTGADVVVLGPRMDPLNALAVAELLDQAHPEITALMVADATPELWELALRAGVRAVLPCDADPGTVREAIDRALEVADRRRQNAVIDLRDDVIHAVDAAPISTGRIITVLAPKGGSGKTTIATNLALGLAAQVPDGVALVDLDLQFGDVADALRLAPAHSLGDIRGRAAHLDSAELKILLTQHENGLFALCAPEDPATAEEITADDISAALSVLAADMPYVVIDTAAGIDDASLAAIDVSTDLVVVASNDVPSIRNLRKLLTALDRIGVTKPTRHLVLNRAGSKVGIDLSDVESALGMDVAVAIPSSRTITLSVNHGSPIIAADPRNPLAQPFRDLVARFTDVPAARSGAFNLFRRTSR